MAWYQDPTGTEFEPDSDGDDAGYPVLDPAYTVTQSGNTVNIVNAAGKTIYTSTSDTASNWTATGYDSNGTKLTVETGKADGSEFDVQYDASGHIVGYRALSATGTELASEQSDTGALTGIVSVDASGNGLIAHFDASGALSTFVAVINAGSAPGAVFATDQNGGKDLAEFSYMAPDGQSIVSSTRDDTGSLTSLSRINTQDSTGQFQTFDSTGLVRAFDNSMADGSETRATYDSSGNVSGFAAISYNGAISDMFTLPGGGSTQISGTEGDMAVVLNGTTVQLLESTTDVAMLPNGQTFGQELQANSVAATSDVYEEAALEAADQTGKVVSAANLFYRAADEVGADISAQFQAAAATGADPAASLVTSQFSGQLAEDEDNLMKGFVSQVVGNTTFQPSSINGGEPVITQAADFLDVGARLFKIAATASSGGDVASVAVAETADYLIAQSIQGTALAAGTMIGGPMVGAVAAVSAGSLYSQYFSKDVQTAFANGTVNFENTMTNAFHIVDDKFAAMQATGLHY